MKPENSCSPNSRLLTHDLNQLFYHLTAAPFGLHAEDKQAIIEGNGL